MLDREAYLAHIDFVGQPTFSEDSLIALHLAHATHIPFENLDILLGKPINIDLASIEAKLVRARRGGYCFEHNRLFAAVLETLGMKPTYLAARVRYRTERLLPRTHLFLLVEINGMKWIADVGFGTVGLLEPMRLIENYTVNQFGWTYRLVNDSGAWTLQSRDNEQWLNLYTFTLDPQFLPDLEVANYYVSTCPDSRFVLTLVVQRSTTAERCLLRNLEFIIDRGGKQSIESLRDQDHLLEVLAAHFDLHFPKGTRFRIPSLAS